MTVNSLGTVRPGTTLVIPFSTYSSDDPSKSITTTELDVGAISVYKDGTATKRASTSGEGVDIDVEAIVGTHWITIDLADNTTAGFYAAGSRYVVILEGLVIDAATAMSSAVATFDIGYPNAIINTTVATFTSVTQFTLTDGPAEADVLIGCKLLFHDVASAVQVAYAYVTDYTVTTKEVFCTTPVGFTFAATDNVSVFLPDNIHAVQGTTQTAGDLATLIQTADTAIDDLATTVGSAGVGLTGIISVGDVIDLSNLPNIPANWITAAGIADAAIDNATFAADVGSTAYATNVMALAADKALVEQKLDHLINAAVTGTDVTDDSIIAFMVDDAVTADWDNYDNTTSALEALNVDNDAIKAKTDSLTFTVAAQVDANMLAISGDTTAADNLEESATSIVLGLAEAGTLSPTIMTSNLAEPTDDHYIGRTVIWTTGVLAGQASDITDYLGSTGQLTYSTVTDSPGVGDAFVIV